MLIDMRGQLGASDSTVYRKVNLLRYAAQPEVAAVVVVHRDHDERGAAIDEADANAACLATARASSKLKPLYAIFPGRFDSLPTALHGALASGDFRGAHLTLPPDGLTPTNLAQLAPYLRSERKAWWVLNYAGGEVPTADQLAQLESLQLEQRAVKTPSSAGPTLISGLLGTAQRIKLTALLRQCRARLPGVYFDTVGATPTDVRSAVRAIGADRVLYGSNAAPNDDDHAACVRAEVAALSDALTPEQLRRVLLANAAELLEIDVADVHPATED